MANDTVAFQADTRTAEKKSDLTALREEGFIPAVVYSKGQPGTAVKLNEHDFMMMLKKHSGENMMIDLSLDGDAAQHVLVKEIQHHPMTQRILHVDFHEISLDRLVKVEVPLEMIGTPKGVTEGSGTMDVHLRAIEVECKASDIVEKIDVEVSDLDIGDAISVGDLTLPADYAPLTAPEVSVVTVLKPRVGAGEDNPEEEEEGDVDAAGDPEVLSEKSEDDDAEKGED